MTRHFDLLIDYDEKKLWEDAEWSELAGKFAVNVKFAETEELVEVAWPLNTDPAYSRIIALRDVAMDLMKKTGAPMPTFELSIVPVYMPFEKIGNIQWLGAFVRFFDERLKLIFVNSWFAETSTNSQVVGILLHELLHAALYEAGDDTEKDATGHSDAWKTWAYALDEALAKIDIDETDFSGNTSAN